VFPFDISNHMEVYSGHEKIAEIELSMSGPLLWAEWHSGRLYTGYLLNDQLVTLAYDARGVVLARKTRDIQRRFQLYTARHLKSLIFDGALHLWVPRSSELIRYDLESLDEVEAHGIALTPELARFNGYHASWYQTLIDQRDPDAMAEFCQANDGEIIRLAPGELFLLEDKPTITFDIHVLGPPHGSGCTLFGSSHLYRIDGGGIQPLGLFPRDPDPRISTRIDGMLSGELLIRTRSREGVSFAKVKP